MGIRFITACIVVFLLAATAAPARAAASGCDPDGVQASGSIYRICMPPDAAYNGILVIWAHGFQHVGDPFGIPEDQLCQNDFCLPDLVTGLGFAFATNSYAKVGMAITQGKDDIIDLVSLFTQLKGAPKKVYLIGASEGGIITTLAIEQRPDLFAAGVAACGPIGSFRGQLDYFGSARVTFEYFFPGLIPGDPFNPTPELVATWKTYYETVVKPYLLDPAHRTALDEWVAVARLPYDPNDYLNTVEQSARDVLLYAVVDLNEAADVLGGFPFGNLRKRYTGSSDDAALNAAVLRVEAAAAALSEVKANYETTGVLARPLVTMHTRLDQQIPFWHEQLYALKTLLSGSLLTRHVNLPVNRYGHCNFNANEALLSFGIMLLYDGILQNISGVGSYLSGERLAAFEEGAKAARLPYRVSGSRLRVILKP